jgi:hypothetical protein
MDTCKAKMCWFFICIWLKVLEMYEWEKIEKKINYNVLSTLVHTIVQKITGLFFFLKNYFFTLF